ncbi:MAG: bifunctional diguanylate cyclase/phosphodiesterase [Silicimonas sp.]|nr:bifunctional diguanylate cyclase/phosphodiesterase [Silicimonas sp.]
MNKQANVLWWSELATSRIGVVFFGVFLLALLFFVANLADRASRDLVQEVQSLNEREIRNGFVAMSEIQRLNFLLFDARNYEGITLEHREDVQAAVDILFVRADHLKSVYPDPDVFKPSRGVIESLDEIVGLTDAYLTETDADYGAFLTQLIDASDRSRRSLHTYLTTLSRESEEITARQTDALLSKTRFLWVAVAALSLVGLVAISLLRREIVARRAREIAEENERFLAFFDPLTKLPNRVQLQNKLAQYLEGRTKTAVAIVDVDNFKSVNDTYGHAVGDDVLRYIAEILELPAKTLNGFAARLSGDEFAVVLPTDDFAKLSEYCRAVISRAARPHKVGNDTITTGVSIGLATTSQISTSRQVEMSWILRAADFSLYRAKAEGRSCYTFYDNDLAAQLEERNAMLEDLPSAITNGDLKLFLQPKVSLPDRAITGFEALVRWQRNGQLVSPVQFITLAEESGLIIDIDKHMLSEAAKTLADWNKLHGTNFGVSVNLSGTHFANMQVVELVRAAIEKSGITPSLLTLEITESVQLNDWALVQNILCAFRDLGVKISIDDFGAGYSSLAYLRAIAADELKIDRSLVSEIHESEEAAFVLDSVVDLAKNLNMDVIVEGIENEDQARRVFDLGVSKAQGYLFGAPVMAKDALRNATAYQTEKRTAVALR